MKSNATFFYAWLLAAPMAFLLQGIVLAQANQSATTSQMVPVAEGQGLAFRDNVVFYFRGGRLEDFLRAVDEQYKVEWSKVASIPQDMQFVSIPRLRLGQEFPPVPTGRQKLLQKLQTIPYNLDNYENGVSFVDVIRDLQKNSKHSDLDKIGINFQFNPRAGGNTAAASSDAAAVAVVAPMDPKDITIKISPPLVNLTLNEALNAICKMAELPAGTQSSGLTFSIDDDVVWFFLKTNGSTGGGLSSDGRDGKEVTQHDPLEALIALYNSLQVEWPEFGKLIVEGDLAKPSIVMFQPTPSTPITDFKMKAFPLQGIPSNEWQKLTQSADQKLRTLAQIQGNMDNRHVYVELQQDVGLLVVMGPDSILQGAESFVTAWQSNRSPIGHGSDPRLPPTTEPAPPQAK